MATLKMTTGAVMDTVTETAVAVSGVVKSVGVGAAMLHDFVQDQRATQLKMLSINKEFRKDQVLHTKMVEIDQIMEGAQHYMDESPERAQRCQAIMARLEKAWGE